MKDLTEEDLIFIYYKEAAFIVTTMNKQTAEVGKLEISEVRTTRLCNRTGHLRHGLYPSTGEQKQKDNLKATTTKTLHSLVNSAW